MVASSLYLSATDFVGISFFVISMAMLATTAFFILERNDVVVHWRTSISIAALVTGIAFVHYMYMRGMWIETNHSPTVYRYIDWFITVPLQIVEFYIILKAVGYKSTQLFWQLLIASILMLVFGFIGEAYAYQPLIMFTLGTIAWLYIILELFFGQVNTAKKSINDPASSMAINGLRWIVTVGWSIYPIGYILGHLVSQNIDASSLNIVYNLADFINKIAFGLIIWSAAKKATQ
jgi:bacteriorhodopsin